MSKLQRGSISLAVLVTIVALIVTASGGVSLRKNAGDAELIGALEELDGLTSDESLGGLVHVIQEDFAGGISVNGTEIISSSGGLTPTTGSFSSTLTITGAATLASTLAVTGESNLARTIQGGSVLALTTASSTLTAAQVCDNSGIRQVASTTKTTVESVGTITLPATSTLYADANCLTANGDYMELVYINATSSYGASTTFAKGTGIELMKSLDTGGTVTILPQEKAILKFYRYSIATTTVAVDVFENGD